MKTTWTKGKDKETEKLIRTEYRGAKYIRGVLRDLLREKITSEQRSQRNKEGYDSPNWAYKQADSQGYIRAIHEIIALIED